nr:hypothetical protein [Tanacetum cinerariifolium]
MDWLYDHKAEIICHEKVVKIPLLDGKVLRVLGERPKEKVRLLVSAKDSDKKQEEISVVRDFPEFLGHVINGNRIHVDHSKIKVVKNWKARKTPSKVCSFLGLVGYYRSFIENFSKIAKSLTILTQKFLPNRSKDLMVYCDASEIGLGCVLMHRELFRDYDCEIRYHPGKENMVDDALSRKERVKPKRVRAMNMTLVGIKRLLRRLEVTVVKVCVTAAKQNLVLFCNLNEKYAK